MTRDTIAALMQALQLARPLVEKSADVHAPEILWSIDAAMAKVKEIDQEEYYGGLVAPE